MMSLMQKSSKDMYDSKSISYFCNPRVDLLELIPASHRDADILEIGAGCGDTLLYAKENGYAKRIYAIDIMRFEGSNQDSEIFEKFIVGDIQNMELDFKEEMFDVIIAGDILEHLQNPQEVILRLKKHLKPDGLFIASIPNFRYYKVLYTVFFKGDFKYENSGILDKTHLRFFCRKNIIELFDECGFVSLHVTSEFEKLKNTKGYMLNKLFFNKLKDFFIYQFFIVAKK